MQMRRGAGGLPRRRGREVLAEIFGEPIVPESLRRDAGACIGAAGTRHDEDTAPAEDLFLCPQLDGGARTDDGAPAGDALEAGDARCVPLQLLLERPDAAGE